MKFSSTSQYMLKYQKAKAKLVEYGVNMDDYPKFPLNSNELSYPTIYIISRYVESIIENKEIDRSEFSSLLTVASQYFDAAVNAKDRDAYDVDFLLSGATAYFLSDDFGSAKVLCSKIKNKGILKSGTPQALLKSLYDFLLMGKNISYLETKTLYDEILNTLTGYFKMGKSIDGLEDVLMRYRQEVYNQDDSIAIYYVDILYAVVLESVKKSSWSLLPRYSNLEGSLWSDYLRKPNAIRILWPSQQLIGEQGILRGSNAIIQLPTGVGKTKSIELIIRAAFLAKRASTAIIIAPLRALCNEITNDMTRAFDDDVLINQFSDVLQEDFSFELWDMFKMRIIICTPEKLSYIMHHQAGILSDIELFIFDEGHMFDDGTRGTTYEFLVSEIRSQITKQQQMVFLSAVLSNAEQIKQWLFNEDGVLASSEKIRATPKSIGFASQTKDINYFSDNADEADYYIPKSINVIELKKLSREYTPRLFPKLSDKNDIAIFYAIKLCHNGGVAIYVSRTSTITTIIKRILDLKKREYDLTQIAKVTDKIHADKICNLITEYYGENHEFVQAAKLGVFPHYANLPNGIKTAVEYAFRCNYIRFVVCTSTLAQGVNIPIKYLFMTSFRASQNSMQIRSFQNLMGRTARSGMYTEGSVVITDPKYYDQRTDRKHGGNYRWRDCLEMFNPNATEPCGSSILYVVKDIAIDYEVTLNGKKIAEFIINNFMESNCFESLVNIIREWFSQKYPDKNPDLIVRPIMFRKDIVESIENHLCFIYSSNDEADHKEKANNICHDTLAYALASDEEKELLINLFSAIAQRIKTYSNEQIQDFARTMSGIDLSVRIEKWINEKDITSVFLTEEQLLDMIISFFKETHTVKIAPESFDSLCKSWVSGKMFDEMYRKLNSEVFINTIEDVCSKTISYELSFFVGNIIDMLRIDTDDEDAVNPYFTLCSLQKKIKYGVPSETSVSICEKIFNERYLAIVLSDLLENENITSNDIIDFVKYNHGRILEILSDYPDNFTERLEQLLL